MSALDRSGFLVNLTNMALDAYPGEIWFAVDAQTRDQASGTGLICAYLEDGKPFYRIGPETMADALDMICSSKPSVKQVGPDEWQEILVNDAGENLYMSPERHDRIVLADEENDATRLTVDDALAVLECALFGQVVYQ